MQNQAFVLVACMLLAGCTQFTGRTGSTPVSQQRYLELPVDLATVSSIARFDTRPSPNGSCSCAMTIFAPRQETCPPSPTMCRTPGPSLVSVIAPFNGTVVSMKTAERNRSAYAILRSHEGNLGVVLVNVQLPGLRTGDSFDVGSILGSGTPDVGVALIEDAQGTDLRPISAALSEEAHRNLLSHGVSPGSLTIPENSSAARPLTCELGDYTTLTMNATWLEVR